MMTEQLGFSVLTAPLAAIDRRALSQAWLSALHEASPAAGRSKAHGSATMAQAQTNAAVKPEAAPPQAKRPALHGAVAKTVDRRDRVRAEGTAPTDRRAARSRLARDIERTFLKPTAQIQRASFEVQGNARVHITLQTEGNRVRLIALCQPSQRAGVAEALAQARFALAGRGYDISLQVR